MGGVGNVRERRRDLGVAVDYLIELVRDQPRDRAAIIGIVRLDPRHPGIGIRRQPLDQHRIVGRDRDGVTPRR